MTDWALVAIRFAVYADLMLLVGLAAFPLYSFTRAERDEEKVLPLVANLTWLALAGLVLSAFGFTLSSASMMGVPLSAINVPMLLSIASESEQGAAWLVRTASLASALTSLIMLRFHPSLQYGLVLVCGSIALATLLWSGHAAATESALGTAHRASDIAHMISAAIWLGGIAAFGLLLSQPASNLGYTRLVARSLAGFSRVGTVAVIIIGLTGLFNSYAILGSNLMRFFQSLYGTVLMAKLILFAAMLMLAAHNRWNLSPALSNTGDDTKAPLTRLRISIALESAAGAGILALVAWLGTLAAI